MRFGEVLIELGFIKGEKLEFALDEQEYNLKTTSFSEPIGNILLRNGLITEEQQFLAAIKYFGYIRQDDQSPESAIKMADIAIKTLENQGLGKLSMETCMILINKLQEFEEMVHQLSKSALPQKDVMIANLQKKIDLVIKDLTALA